MTQIKPDKVTFASSIDTFLNYETPTTTMTISGSLADGASDLFTAELDISEPNTLPIIFAENQNTGKKMSLRAGNVHHPYQAVSTEAHTHYMGTTGGTLKVYFSVTNNTGGPITLTTQTWTITAVLQRVPF